MKNNHFAELLPQRHPPSSPPLITTSLKSLRNFFWAVPGKIFQIAEQLKK